MNNPKRVAIYARVSTDGQNTDNQQRELRTAHAAHTVLLSSGHRVIVTLLPNPLPTHKERA